jgi:hypothetical protein
MRLVSSIRVVGMIFQSRLSDLFFILAVIAFMRGAYLIYPPAMWIVAGAALMVLAVGCVQEIPNKELPYEHKAN